MNSGHVHNTDGQTKWMNARQLYFVFETSYKIMNRNHGTNYDSLYCTTCNYSITRAAGWLNNQEPSSMSISYFGIGSYRLEVSCWCSAFSITFLNLRFLLQFSIYNYLLICCYGVSSDGTIIWPQLLLIVYP
jgi:hypothetical protein